MTRVLVCKQAQLMHLLQDDHGMHSFLLYVSSMWTHYFFFVTKTMTALPYVGCLTAQEKPHVKLYQRMASQNSKSAVGSDCASAMASAARTDTVVVAFAAAAAAAAVVLMK